MPAIFFALAVAASVCEAQWVHTNLPDSDFVVCFAVSGTNLFAGTLWGTGIFLTTNNGTSWTAVNEGLARDSLDPTKVVDVHCFESTGQSLFAGTGSVYSGGGIFRSTNNGSSWAAVDSGISWRNSETRRVRAIVVSGTNLFAGVYGNILHPGTPSLDNIYRSTDNGTSWMMCMEWYDLGINALAVSETNIYAVVAGSVYRSTDNGTNWTLASEGLPPNAALQAFAVSGSNLFAGNYFGGVFLSTNNGASWSAAGLTNTGVLAFACLGTNLFAGTAGSGVFLSTNNGTSWTAVNSGLTDTFIWSLTVSGTNLFAGTLGGVWRRPLSEMITSVSPGAQLPTDFVLEQNYPNPVNPSTTIRYGLPHTSFVTLTVYNTLGQRVAQLVNEQQHAGYHDVVFRGDGLASGVYFYRLQAGSFVDVKKFILLK